MKNKLIILLSIFLLLTGCGNSNYILDQDNKIVKYDKTGQMLQKDILCLPEEDGELYELYDQYKDQLKFKLEDLPKCENFKMNSNESSGLWEFLFVKPLAYLIIKLGYLVKNMGISVILIGLAIRLILLPFSIKTAKQSQNMKKAQPEIEKIERKYRNRTDNDALMAKSQETMMVYKKYKINPVSSCLVSFIQFPVFFAFLQAIYRIPVIYEQSLLGLQLGTTPLVGIKSGNYFYLLLLVLIAVSTYFSFRQTMNQTGGQTPEMAKQMKIMLYVMLVVIVYGSLNFPTALSFYWITTYAFIAIQNIVLGAFNKDKKSKKRKIIDAKVKE